MDGGVAFPSSESTPVRLNSAPYSKPHLPFRRISLPTPPSIAHRQSVISIASFDSLAEEGIAHNVPVSPLRSSNSHKKLNLRPGSMEALRRNRKREPSPKPVDAALEGRRQKIIKEFYDTEKVYVEGLELIYSHFLTPIVNTLETDTPLLDRSVLTALFSNFIDIWNFHRSFFSSLRTTLFPPNSSGDGNLPPPEGLLSSILLSHFPYLSLYTPFITSFPSTISSLMDFITPPNSHRLSPRYNHAFATFLLVQEANPRCGKLKLRDWLLTIVQRCPRYLLLLKDLINCTDPKGEEYRKLVAAHGLVSKITTSLNTSLHMHAQTMSLLALQRSTPNLPFQLITPGRTLLKRGSLYQVERSEPPKEREFLLFSDYIIWLAGEELDRWKGDWIGWGNSDSANSSKTNVGLPVESQAEILSPERPEIVRTRSKSEAELPALQARVVSAGRRAPPSPSKSKSAIPPRRKDSKLNRQVSSTTNPSDEKWTFKGKAELVDLEVIIVPPREPGDERKLEILSPEGSFVCYADTETERDEWSSAIRQAKEQRLTSLNATHPNSTLTSSSSTTHLRRALQALPFRPSDERSVSSYVKPGSKDRSDEGRRGRVEHWVPAIWIPDEKAGGCMRCGKSFGWRRRRHHCRLCGRCVCASCSDRTFFVSDPNSKTDESKPARACNACYETVFPLLDPLLDDADDPTVSLEDQSNTISSLSNLPSWMSMPSLPLPTPPASLMAIDINPRRERTTIVETDDTAQFIDAGRVRMRSPSSRPRSFHQILEDFDSHDVLDDSPLEKDEDENRQRNESHSTASSKRHTVDLSISHSSRKEDTARRNKRFSLPAVALQTTSVTAHTYQSRVGTTEGNGPRPKRFSLILSGRRHGPGYNDGNVSVKSDLGRGVAAGKLNELLGKKVSV